MPGPLAPGTLPSLGGLRLGEALRADPDGITEPSAARGPLGLWTLFQGGPALELAGWCWLGGLGTSQRGLTTGL